MSFDLKVFGQKLNRCRKHLELSLEEVSRKVGLEPLRIDQLEKGMVEPSGDEVLILADFYLQDYHYFISNEQKSTAEQVETLYRKLGKEISKQDKWSIQEFLFLCECEEFVLNGVDYYRKEFKFNTKGILYRQQGVEAANALRKFLGYNDDQVIPDIYQELRKIGLHIFRRRLENSNISGLFLSHPNAGRCILVNYDEDVFRQNFTVAHETGHAILDYGETVNISFAKDDTKDAREVRANAFASAFLVPPGLKERFQKISWTDELLKSTSIKLKINPIVLVYALKNMGILNNQDLYKFKYTKLNRDEKIDAELANLGRKIHDAKVECFKLGLSKFYIMKCYDAYSAGVISSNRMAEMLLTSTTELPALLSLFNLNLQNEY